MGGDGDDGEPVGVPELVRGLEAGSRHPGEASVETEEALEADPGEGLVGRGHGQPLLGLDGLVQSLSPRPVGHRTARGFVDDHDPAVDDHVLAADPVELAGHEGLSDPFLAAFRRSPDPRQSLASGLDLPFAGPREPEFASVLDHRVVRLRGHRSGDVPGLEQRLGETGMLLRGGQDQRGDRLVDEHAVRLVDERCMEAVEDLGPLGSPLGVPEPVPKEVRSDLLARDVGDIGGKGATPFLRGHRGRHPGDLESTVPDQRGESPGVPFHEVVVHRHDMAGAAGPGPEDRGQDRGEGLALAGGHLDQAAVVERQRALELFEDGMQAEASTRVLAQRREGTRQRVPSGRSAATQLLPEVREILVEPILGEVAELGVEPFDGFREGPISLLDRGAAPVASDPTVRPGIQPLGQWGEGPDVSPALEIRRGVHT